MLKQVKASKMLVEEMYSTHAREARTTTGTKFSKNVKRVKRENELKADAMRPLLELQQKFNGEDDADTQLQTLLKETIDALAQADQDEQ